MTNNTNTIRLTEEQLHQVVREAAIRVINEGRFGDMAKRAGKFAGKAALATGMLYAADQGLENEYQHNQELNRQSVKMAKDPEAEYIKDHGLDPNNAISWDEARQATQDNMAESKESKLDKLIETVVRKNIQKLL